MNFASDNGAGVAPEILEAIAASSRVNAPAYGADDYTARAEAMLSEIFETQVDAFLVATGTAANALALSALARPWEAVFCHEEAHIHDDECGAPEFFTGGGEARRHPRVRAAKSRLRSCARRSSGFRAGSSSRRSAGRAIAVAGHRSRDGLPARRGRRALRHCSCGRRRGAYGRRAVRECARRQPAFARRNDLARRSRRAFLRRDQERRARLRGGRLLRSGRAAELPYRRKRAGHTLSKGRFLGAQMEAYLKDGLWLRLAERANRAARRLSERLAAARGVRLAWPTEANEVFVVAPNAVG